MSEREKCLKCKASAIYDYIGETDRKRLIGYTCGGPGSVSCLRRQLAAANEAREKAEEDVASLRGIVGRLPKTADGVTVYVDLEVWGRALFPGRIAAMYSLSCDVVTCRPSFKLAPHVPYTEVYSTRAAAEAAAEKEKP